MWVWRERREQWLLGGVLLAFVLIVLVNLKLPVWTFLNGGTTAAFLRAEATGSVISDLLVGLVSAYVFYIVIELAPKHRREQQTLRALNLLVASVIDAFDRVRLFGHETPITSIDLAVLDIPKIKAHISNIMTRPELLRLKFAMETSDSRYQDFQHALTLAASLSPGHALDWLVLTDKMRLLAQEYGTQPTNPFADNDFGEPTPEQLMQTTCLRMRDEYKEEMKMFESTLQLRVMEVFEASVFWMERQAS